MIKRKIVQHLLQCYLYLKLVSFNLLETIGSNETLNELSDNYMRSLSLYCRCGVISEKAKLLESGASSSQTPRAGTDWLGSDFNGPAWVLWAWVALTEAEI